tara:strand:+ start:367 stop:519 length:153 start_codon:yes stop_codon:yes gene_type:complete
MITPLQSWQEQINFYENTILKLEDEGKAIPKQYINGLKLAKAAKKSWLNK